MMPMPQYLDLAAAGMSVQPPLMSVPPGAQAVDPAAMADAAFGRPPPAAPPPPPPGQPIGPPMAPVASAELAGPAPPPPESGPPSAIPFGLIRAGGGGVTPARDVNLEPAPVKLARENEYGVARQVASDVTQQRVEPYDQEITAMRDEFARARAREQETAAEVSRRAAEAEAKQQDFNRYSAEAQQRAKVDPNRFWASKSTGQKAMFIIGAALSGFASRGGPNVSLQAIQHGIDNDIRAQEFAYGAAKDRAQQANSAFGMAMQRWGNADVARAAARGAALENVQLMQRQFAAMHQRADVVGRAKELEAAIAAQQTANAKEFWRHVQPQSYGATFVDPQTGITYSNKEAQAYAKERQSQNVEIGKTLAQGQSAMTVAQIGHAGKDTKAINEETSGISKQLQQAGVPQARTSVERALELMNKSEGGIAEAAVRGAAPRIVAEKVLSEDANAREQAFEIARADMIHALTGAGMSEKERANYHAMFGAASTPEARKRTLVAANARLDELERNALAGASPAAQEAFRRQREEAKAGKPRAPDDVKKGWK